MTNRKPMTKATRRLLLLGAGLLAARALRQKLREASVFDQVVLITGGSRGLGLALAEEFARHGCRLALTARDTSELARARGQLAGKGREVFTTPCDLSVPAEVTRMITEVTERYGRIDILVTNAGSIEVGPVQNMTRQDFEDTLAVDFWGTLDPILSVLPQMRARGSGRLVLISSIGGKVAFPHLLPYVVAKFAVTGLGEGLRAELAREGIAVTLIAPGLLRTGSYFQAQFKGDQPKEFAWFGLGDSLPGGSISAERAAREIVTATRRGDAERVLSLPARLLSLLHGVAPGATTRLLTLVNNTLLPPPSSSPEGQITRTGHEAAPDVPARPLFEALTGLGQAAAKRLNERLNEPSGPDRG